MVVTCGPMFYMEPRRGMITKSAVTECRPFTQSYGFKNCFMFLLMGTSSLKIHHFRIKKFTSQTYTKPSGEPNKINLRVAACVNDNPNFVKDFEVNTQKWTQIAIAQERIGSKYKVL